jgi:hypothetical protein
MRPSYGATNYRAEGMGGNWRRKKPRSKAGLVEQVAVGKILDFLVPAVDTGLFERAHR